MGRTGWAQLTVMYHSDVYLLNISIEVAAGSEVECVVVVKNRHRLMIDHA